MIQITRHITPGSILKTPSGRAEFEVYHIDSQRVVLSVGLSRTPLTIPAQCFEDIPKYLAGKGWVKLGATHQKSNEDTLDTYIKQYTKGTSAASYVAPILEKSNIAVIDRKKPAKIKLK